MNSTKFAIHLVGGVIFTLMGLFIFAHDGYELIYALVSLFGLWNFYYLIKECRKEDKGETQ